MQTWVRRLTILLAGVFALAGAFWLWVRLPHLGDTARNFLILLPPALAAFGASLGAWFHRDRAVFLHAVLAGGYLIPLVYWPGGTSGAVLFDGLSLFIPLNLLIFGLLPARGLVSAAGAWRVGLVGLQAGAVAAAVAAPGSSLGRLVDQAPAFPATALGPWSIGLFALAAAVAGGQWLRTRESLYAGILVAGGGTAWALHTDGDPGAVVAGWALGHLGLIAAQLQESYRLAFLDGLTGLPGRRALEEHLARLGGGYSVAMVDVDHFKRFNDRYGHDAGDHVLRLVARQLARVKEGGRAFRYGGEEFAVIFPGRGVEEAHSAMETVRDTIAQNPFRLREGEREPGQRGKGGGREVKVSVSAGVAHSSGDGNPIQQADKALYRAKKRGRNRVCS